MVMMMRFAAGIPPYRVGSPRDKHWCGQESDLAPALARQV